MAARLPALPSGVRVLESGIGGMSLVQELMTGCDGLIIVDAIDRGAPPGTLFFIEPEIGEPSTMPDIHLANPDRVLAMAKGLGCLPDRLVLVGCQQGEVDELQEGLTPAVAAAVDPAVDGIRDVLEDWLGRASGR